MGLSKVKIGSFVELYSENCNIPNLTVYDVSGVNRNKEFFEPSKQVGSNTSKYKVVPPGYFACNLMHVGRDVVLPIALNHTEKNKIVSPAYTVFKITTDNVILKDFFFIFLNSNERDRYFWFHTDSSVRDGMSWDVFCNLEIEIPDISIQKSYVDIYLGIKKNVEAMNKGIALMQDTFSAYMEKLLEEESCEDVGKYIKEVDVRNEELQYDLNNVRGISIEKKFINTKANMNGVSLKPYKVISPKQFCYVTVTSRNGNKVSIAMNDSEESYIVSSSYVSFEIVSEKLLPEFLLMFFKSAEFDRYARFNSWGSARETFAFGDLGRFKIPIPPKSIQQDIINIFNACETRKKLLDRLINLQRSICPILVKGAVEKGGK